MDTIIRYSGLPIELPSVLGKSHHSSYDSMLTLNLAGSQSLPQTIAHWITEDMIDYRDEIEKKTLAATFKFGLRHVTDDNNTDLIAKNLQCHANTTNDDAFMHLWQVTYNVCYYDVFIFIY
jgi:hypothetical protein